MTLDASARRQVAALRRAGADVTALRLAIRASRRSTRRFAREVLLREPRTVRRWLAGESIIPAAVVEWMCDQGFLVGRSR